MKLLPQMVEQFVKLHGHLPEKIVIAPMAVLALAIKKSLAPRCVGVPIEMRIPKDSEVVDKGKGTKLCVFVKKQGLLNYSLVSCELA
jgi:hypothetical protein